MSKSAPGGLIGVTFSSMTSSLMLTMLRQESPRSRISAHPEIRCPSELLQRSRQEAIRALVARMVDTQKEDLRITAKALSSGNEPSPWPEERHRRQASLRNPMSLRTLMHSRGIVQRGTDIEDDLP